MKKFVIAVAVVIMAAFAVPAFAAMNPFMDVPASHWAYDAVAQLASRGVISGYPDGSYKGAQPATRYEMASIVARALAKVDMEKASKQDVDMLKKLIVEFKDELDALGVKVDKLDARVAVLESEIGGWSMSGQFRFDANFGSGDGTGYYNESGKNDFDLNRYRVFLNKRVNETTRFTARLGRAGHSNTGGTGVNWERYFITTQLGYGVTLTAGRNYFEWEADLGFVGDNDTVVGGFASNMFWFKKDWGMANLHLIFGRINDAMGLPTYAPGYGYLDVYDLEQFYVAGMANFNINEKFRAGILAYYFFADEDHNYGPGLGSTDTDLLTAGVYAGYAFTPAIEGKAIYYYQSMGDSYAFGNDDNANAWRVILDVKQEALKFTSLWLEYGQMDNYFIRIADTESYSGFDKKGLMAGKPWNGGTSKFYGAKAEQQWNDKWRTYVRYFAADYDTNNLDDAFNWTLGVAYRLNPNVEFELAYDHIDYGRPNNGMGQEDDHMVRFRTFVTF